MILRKKINHTGENVLKLFRKFSYFSQNWSKSFLSFFQNTAISVLICSRESAIPNTAISVLICSRESAIPNTAISVLICCKESAKRSDGHLLPYQLGICNGMGKTPNTRASHRQKFRKMTLSTGTFFVITMTSAVGHVFLFIFSSEGSFLLAFMLRMSSNSSCHISIGVCWKSYKRSV